MESPKATLTTGIVVCNFSSPHIFSFDDGTVLGACDDEAMELGNLVPDPILIEDTGLYENVAMSWELTPELQNRLAELQSDIEIDIIVVPLPVLVAIGESGKSEDAYDKCKGCVTVDRKTKVVSHKKFVVYSGAG